MSEINLPQAVVAASLRSNIQNPGLPSRVHLSAYRHHTRHPHDTWQHVQVRCMCDLLSKIVHTDDHRYHTPTSVDAVRSLRESFSAPWTDKIDSRLPCRPRNSVDSCDVLCVRYPRAAVVRTEAAVVLPDTGPPASLWQVAPVTRVRTTWS